MGIVQPVMDASVQPVPDLLSCHGCALREIRHNGKFSIKGEKKVEHADLEHKELPCKV